jgi:inhibitor of KinA
MPESLRPRILLCGETAVSVEFGESFHSEAHRSVHALSAFLRAQSTPGIIEVNPTYRSLFVEYDPWQCSYEQLLMLIEKGLNRSTDELPSDHAPVDIPVCYGFEFGPDLCHVASTHGLSPEAVIQLHSTPVYDVVMVGFTPGFPYLSGLDQRLFTPRKASPRKVVPAGSVGIADRQSGIYSLDSPGGWQIIGRTPLRIFDPGKADPFLIRAGNRVRFTPITRDQFEIIADS